MKLPYLLVLAGAFATQSVFAQNTEPAPAAPARPELTPEQIKNVLKQLDELEKSILSQRGTSLGSIIQKLRSAASSDAATINFLAECDKLVNVERKDGDRQDAKRIEQRKEAEKRGETRKETEKDGDHATALRLCLEYMALTLEANETKDLKTMVPKLLAFHQTMLAQAKKLHGAAGELLMRPVGGGGGGRNLGVGVVVQAYQLDSFLKPQGWPTSPGDIIEAYDKFILKTVREKETDKLAAGWDTALNNELGFRKERMAEGEYTVWAQQSYPRLRWSRAIDLTTHGPSPVAGLGEQLKVIKEFPNHPDSPGWIAALRSVVAPADDKTSPPPTAP